MDEHAGESGAERRRQHALDTGPPDPATRARLAAEHDKLNPARITRGINHIQQQLIDLAKARTLGTRPAA